MENVLRLAVQKSGRLSEDSLKLIKECGISFNQGLGKLKCEAFNFPLEFLFLRDDDIPQYVSNGIADIGFVGENVLLETGEKTNIIQKLGFSKCRLSLAVPNDFEYQNIKSLDNKSIATSYPNILKKYLEERNIKADIHIISGSVEIAPSIGLAEAICDLVSSGSTLLSNGLREVEVVLKSEAVLIAHPKMNDLKQKTLSELLFRIESVQKAKDNKYILMNVPNHSIDKISKILPVMKSPTIMPLAIEGWSSLHSVVKEDDFWGIINELKLAGAEGILVIPIEKMIF
ncbi:MAG: ATP phosphoribosyltransferase [Bacteroidetes bacterium]|nr:MAG: ATP phosphoribosyltransferase [Bacteroidota bacterium]TAG85183.1 MAG: ATP phosphoribosyltransferase [Bacteroidota bacterium]